MKLWRGVFAVLIVSIIIVAGCYFFGNNDEEDNGSKLEVENGNGNKNKTLTVENYPRVDGSTSTHPLAMIIACKLLNISYNWQDSLFDESKRVIPNSSEPKKEYIAENITQTVVHHGTHGSYVNLIENKTDLILVARKPSEDELTLAKDLGVKLEIKPIALDAFVFILNYKNQVTNLTEKQIQEIYTENITTWDQVGGSSANITPYRRNDNSGSQELMETLVMRDFEMIEGEDLILWGMMGPFSRLLTDENGICFSVYFYEEFMAPNEHISLCGIEGIVPNYETISTREYKYTTEVYAAIRTDMPKTNSAYTLWSWLDSPSGQAVVKESGYVPIN
jgi:phosphate transport system substrate-binding protein